MVGTTGHFYHFVKRRPIIMDDLYRIGPVCGGTISETAVRIPSGGPYGDHHICLNKMGGVAIQGDRFNIAECSAIQNFAGSRWSGLRGHSAVVRVCLPVKTCSQERYHRPSKTTIGSLCNQK